jgi:hypothetical protein
MIPKKPALAKARLATGFRKKIMLQTLGAPHFLPVPGCAPRWNMLKLPKRPL